MGTQAVYHYWQRLQDGNTGLEFAALRLPEPTDRPPITPRRAVNMLPVFLLYFLMALLVLLPRTRIYRLAVLPLVLYSAFKAATQYDFSAGAPTMNHMNYGMGVVMFVLSLRCIDWATVKEPLQKLRSSSQLKHSVFYDAGDLLCNLRGLGWTWSRGLQIPHDSRPLNSRKAFLTATVGRLVRDLLICDTLHYLVQSLSPETFGSTRGGTIFDPSLPPVPRYLYSTFITTITGLVIYFEMTMQYHLTTVLAFAIPGLNHDPASWPPFSEGPWKATSLADFWGRKWHQMFRRVFIAVGGNPMYKVFGRVGGVFGIFLLSGILHDWCIWPMGRGTNFLELGGFFVLSGIGLLIEKSWEHITGAKVKGVTGWFWTTAWVLSTGNLLADAWLTAGLAGCALLPEPIRPVKLIAEKLLSRRP